MRHLIHIALSLTLSFSAFGQKLYPLKNTYDSIAFRLSVQNGNLTILAPTESEIFQNKKDFPTLLALRFEASDLVLEYQLQKSTEMLSNIKLHLQLPDGQNITPLPFEVSDVEQPSKIRRLVWLDAAEHLPDFSALYVLHIHRLLMGGVNCERTRPSFTLKKQLPHYTAGVVGLGLVGLGQLYRNQRDDSYADYQLRWADGLPSFIGENNPLNTAKEKDQNARICTWAGLAIISVDAIAFILRDKKIKKHQKVYDKFCGSSNSFNIQPVWLPGSGLECRMSCIW